MAFDDYDSQVNDGRLDEIAEIVDNDFFTHSIEEQIEKGLDCSTINYLDMLDSKITQLQGYTNDEVAGVLEFRDELYERIISLICQKYDIEISYEDCDLDNTARKMYSLFAIDIKEMMVSFISGYVTAKYEVLINSIGINNLKTDYIQDDVNEDMKTKLITAGNVGVLIDHVIDLNLGFDEFIKYAALDGSQTAIDIENREHIISVDDGEIFNQLMKDMSNSQYDHNILMSIYERIIYNLNVSKRDAFVYGDSFNYDMEDDNDGE